MSISRVNAAAHLSQFLRALSKTPGLRRICIEDDVFKYGRQELIAEGCYDPEHFAVLADDAVRLVPDPANAQLVISGMLPKARVATLNDVASAIDAAREADGLPILIMTVVCTRFHLIADTCAYEANVSAF